MCAHQLKEAEGQGGCLLGAFVCVTVEQVYSVYVHNNIKVSPHKLSTCTARSSIDCKKTLILDLYVVLKVM